MKIPFIKMHTLHNHYAYVNNLEQDLKDVDLSDLALKISDPYDGLGTDGLVVIEKSNFADLKMRIFNKDGSEGNICVNALFAISLYAYEERLIDSRKMYIETNSQVVFSEINNNNVTIYLNKFKIQEDELVDIGNYHLIKYIAEDYSIDDSDNAQDLSERFDANVGFAKVADDCIYLITYERGSGITQACGSNACATALMTVHKDYKKVNEEMKIKTLGGEYLVTILNYYIRIKATPRIVLKGEFSYRDSLVK